MFLSWSSNEQRLLLREEQLVQKAPEAATIRPILPKWELLGRDQVQKIGV